MKKILFLAIFCTLIFPAYPEGFAADVLIHVPDGLKYADEIQLSDHLISYGPAALSSSKVIAIEKRLSTDVFYLIINGEEFWLDKDQKLYLPVDHQWRKVREIQQGDLVLTLNNHVIPVEFIEPTNHEMEMIAFSLRSPHTFALGVTGVITHNFAIMLPAVTYIIGEGVVWATVGGVAMAFFTSIFYSIKERFERESYHSYYKKFNHPKNNLNYNGNHGDSDSGGNNNRGPGNNNDNNGNNDDPNTWPWAHPNGLYEDADYHGEEINGRKNPRPKNGQECLDFSFFVEGEGKNTPRRIGVSKLGPKKREIAVLDRTQDGRYHGHTRTWDELTPPMKRTLIKNKVTNHRGKFLW